MSELHRNILFAILVIPTTILFDRGVSRYLPEFASSLLSAALAGMVWLLAAILAMVLLSWRKGSKRT